MKNNIKLIFIKQTLFYKYKLKNKLKQHEINVSKMT